MVSKIVFLCCFFVICCAQYEGEFCTTRAGLNGVCKSIGNCKTAIEDIKNKKFPENCGFAQSTPIVCCLDKGVPTAPSPFQPIITTTSRSSRPSTQYVPLPPQYIDNDSMDRSGECEIIPPNMTAKPTGQKAFDNCIAYQHKYVYPCEKSPALTGEVGRANHCYHNADYLILGGNDTLKNEFPHMVMLGYGDNEQSLSWLCGGSIISDRFVLTAGHCISTRDTGEVTYVLVGAHSRSDARIAANRYKVRRIVRHPEYKPPAKYNDITLLETEKVIQLSQFVVPACLHVGDPVVDDKVLATGWGLTAYKGSTSEILQKVVLNKFSDQECLQKYPPQRHLDFGYDAATQICYGDRTEVKDTCQGDSGGPIQIKYKKIDCMYTIVGITSFGKGCGFPGEPAIYTRVAHYVPWIESIVWP